MTVIQKPSSICWMSLFTVAVIFIASCGKPRGEKEYKEYTVDTGRGYYYAPNLPDPLNRILPEDQIQPVSFDGVKIVAIASHGEARIIDTISSNELAQISAIIGRIAGIDRRVESLELAWLECPVAAKVKIRDYELLFVKSSQGKWEAAGSARVISDFFGTGSNASSTPLIKP